MLELIVDSGSPPGSNIHKGVAHINVAVMAHWGLSIGDLVSFNILVKIKIKNFKFIYL